MKRICWLSLGVNPVGRAEGSVTVYPHSRMLKTSLPSDYSVVLFMFAGFQLLPSRASYVPLSILSAMAVNIAIY